MIPPASGRDRARRRHLEALWDRILAEPSIPQFDRWLARTLRAEPGFGKRDREWYADRLFSAWRFGYFALAARASHSPEALDRFWKVHDAPDAILGAWRAAARGSFFDSLEARVDAIGEPREEAGPLAITREELENRGLRGRLSWCGIPVWFAPFLERRAAASSWDRAALERFVLRHETRPPVWLRMNDEAAAPKVEAELRDRGFRVERRGRALAVEGRTSLFMLDAFREGRFEIQDLASQAIGDAVPLRAGEMIWDACAGGGGKSIQLSTAPELAGHGAVYASDNRAYKLDEVKRRARRAGVSNIRTIAWQGIELPAFGREVERRGGFYSVLVDAPCSATGTWRRNPDAMFRFRLAALPSLVALQGRLLSSASRAVRPGGHLVYATCSFFVEENEEVVERFREAHTAFALSSQRAYGNPEEDSDATFVAVLQRVE